MNEKTKNTLNEMDKFQQSAQSLKMKHFNNYVKNNLNNPYSRNSNNSNNNFNTNYQIAPYLHGKDYINFNNNLDQKKISKRKSFLYLTYLYRNGKFLYEKNNEMVNKDNLKNHEKIYNEYKNEKFNQTKYEFYNNRTDPYKQAFHLYEYYIINKKKFVSNENFEKVFLNIENNLKNFSSKDLIKKDSLKNNEENNKNDNKNENEKDNNNNNNNNNVEQKENNNNNFVFKNIFGRKSRDIPFDYSIPFTFQNDYSNNSEKSRHFFLINELTKLHSILERNKGNEFNILTDFLSKFKINSKDFTLKEMMKLNYVLFNNYQKIKPNLDIKKMIIDIMKNEEIDDKKENNKKNNNNIELILKKNKYISPFIKNKTFQKKYKIDNIKHFENLPLEKQKDLKVKNYNVNLQLIIDDTEKDIKQFEKDFYNKTHLNFSNKNNNNKEKKFKFITSFNNFNMTNNNFNSNVMNKTFYNTNLNFTDINNSKNSMSNCIIAPITKTEFYKTNSTFKSTKKEKKSLDEITERLYYKHFQRPINMDDIKKEKKITEYINYTNARNRLFLNKNELK